MKDHEITILVNALTAELQAKQPHCLSYVRDLLSMVVTETLDELKLRG